MTARILAPLAASIAIALAAPALAEEAVRAFKDPGPAGVCDTHAKGSAAWTACLGAARAGMPDDELFYAGYWLARTGRYAEALGYLSLARDRSERVLTYIGFATRKLGDVDAAMPFYAEALAKNPNFTVARAYLGEAYLAKGEPEKARRELGEIERRCGKSCAEYADLLGHIAAYDKTRG